MQGLAVGTDDYLNKPFSAKELVARVKALRRAYGLGYRDVRRTNGVVVDSYQRHAFLSLLDLRGKEFDLLAQLVSSPGRAYREQLLEAFGVITLGRGENGGCLYSQTSRKSELGPAHPDYIQTVWGVAPLQARI